MLLLFADIVSLRYPISMLSDLLGKRQIAVHY